jgi:hypothetical protein
MKQEQLIARFISLAALAALGENARAKEEIKNFIIYYKKMNNDISPTWRSNGLKYFIKNQNDDFSYKEILLVLLSLVELENIKSDLLLAEKLYSGLK